MIVIASFIIGFYVLLETAILIHMIVQRRRERPPRKDQKYTFLR
jgi:hypothetical protein